MVAGVGPSPEEVGPGRFSIFCYAEHTKRLLGTAKASVTCSIHTDS